MKLLVQSASKDSEVCLQSNIYKIGSENYSGKKIPWAVMPVRVRVPSLVQKYILLRKRTAN